MQLLKSKIQYMTENIQRSQSTRSSMQEGLTSLMDKYMVNDSIFGLNQYGIYEHTNGYFTVISEHESLNDVINVWVEGQAIRVINNKTFQLGEVKKFISECSEESQVFDIHKC